MYGNELNNYSYLRISEGNITLFDDLNFELWLNKLPIVGLILLYMVVGCVGNVLVIYIYTISMKMKKVNRFFIPYLAIVDILSLVFNGSFEIVFAHYQLNFDNDVGCKFIRFLGNVFVILSGILLLMIAVQRYVLVCKPLSNVFTAKKKQYVLVSVVAFTLILSSPKFVFTGIMEIDTMYTNVTGLVCGIKEEFAGSLPLLVYNIILILTGFSAIVTLAVLYSFVVKAIRARNNKLMGLRGAPRKTDITESSITTDPSDSRKVSIVTLPSSRNQSIVSMSNNNSITRSEKIRNLGANSRFSRMFFIITVLCFATYAPRMALENIEASNKNYQKDFSLQKRVLIGFLESFYLFNSVVNPFVYGIFDQDFRKRLKDIFLAFRS
ncbi:hypothetical protein FSP39_020739 [Pinctada imbricata]|uniref:G-protein coupled receptors family 1 profile domain-containing protein n=1 Tax=Pinctada imbricata TaxID=66713 RepID=A0AA88YM70_PINIB|nr:hypothetical protein FSP39_020739 [Pinctada imbricata]